MLILIGLAAAVGCSSSDSANDASSFAAAVRGKYPELKENAYTVDKVKRVVDGDTFELENGDKVRLIGVDTPESTKEIEPFGKEASAYAKEQLTGQTVYLFRDAGNKDTYGRLLRYVFIAGNTEMFNETLVREGYANPMTVPPNVIYAKTFVALERTAREQKKGLWGDPAAANAATASKPPASQAPSGDSAKQAGVPASTACAKPAIKGNINSKKEKIYHLPGGRYYEQTVAEQLFCTEAEAKTAGFRKSAE